VTLVGYARVSTLEQDPALQLDALAAVGCTKIFDDRASGARTDRPGLQRALDYVREDGGELRIGALARHARFEAPVSGGALSGFLPRIARHIGHLPIRSRGTFCGSIAHADPASEWCLLAATLDAVRTRVELAGVEFELHVLGLVRVLVWAVGAVTCALLALAFGVIALVVALWDTHRMLALLGGSALFVVLAVAFGWLAARSLRERPGMLEGSLELLREDVRRTGGAP